MKRRPTLSKMFSRCSSLSCAQGSISHSYIWGPQCGHHKPGRFQGCPRAEQGGDHDLSQEQGGGRQLRPQAGDHYAALPSVGHPQGHPPYGAKPLLAELANNTLVDESRHRDRIMVGVHNDQFLLHKLCYALCY